MGEELRWVLAAGCCEGRDLIVCGNVGGGDFGYCVVSNGGSWWWRDRGRGSDSANMRAVIDSSNSKS